MTADASLGVLLPLAVGVLLLAAWAAWLWGASVRVSEVSSDARLEVDREVHPIAASATGRVVASHLELGERVAAGEVLIELDAESEKRRLEEERQRLLSLRPQLDAVAREITQDAQALQDDREATRFSLEEARDRRAAAASVSRFAAGESQRLTQLQETGAASKVELLRARAEEEQRLAAEAAAGADLGKIQSDRLTRESQTRASIEGLKRESARLAGDIATAEATIAVLQQELEKHLIRAPAAGEVGELTPLQAGAVLREGERVGSIVPTGEIRAVAHLSPAAALGRVRPGQPAELRLDGFPWAEYGSLRARVQQVASEPDERGVRVELQVWPDPAARIPLRHGLPGTVEIEVERASPAALLLRAAGRLGSQAAARP